MLNPKTRIADSFALTERAVVYPGDCLDLLRGVPSESLQLVVTSPPYNIGKEYEKRMNLDLYLSQQARVIAECARALSPSGSICWQVGNYVENGAIVPLDAVLYPIFARLGLKMRNRIIWHFEHGLHCTRRFSGRYETILWFTKNGLARKNEPQAGVFQPMKIAETYSHLNGLEFLMVHKPGLWKEIQDVGRMGTGKLAALSTLNVQ